MDTWSRPERVQERRLWSTLTMVGAVLVLMLLASILVTAGAAGSGTSAWFYLQQAALLVLSVTGTAIAARRTRALRSDS